jgi:hypothetical protein
VKLFQLTGKIPLLYVDEKAPKQEMCVDEIAAMITGYGGAILTPIPSIAKRAIRQVNPTHVLVGLLAGNLLKKGINPIEEAEKIDGLGALALYGYEFTPERTKAIQDTDLRAIFNIKNDLNPELINAIARSGAWIICYDPGSVAKIIGSQ